MCIQQPPLIAINCNEDIEKMLKQLSGTNQHLHLLSHTLLVNFGGRKMKDVEIVIKCIEIIDLIEWAYPGMKMLLCQSIPRILRVMIKDAYQQETIHDIWKEGVLEQENA